MNARRIATVAVSGLFAIGLMAPSASADMANPIGDVSVDLAAAGCTTTFAADLLSNPYSPLPTYTLLPPGFNTYNTYYHTFDYYGDGFQFVNCAV